MNLRRSWVIAATVASLVAFGGGSARAGVITETFNITATGFRADAPVDPVDLSFTVSFDPTKTVVGATTGITLDSANIAVSPATLAFSFFSTSDMFAVGNNGFEVMPLTNEFAATFLDVPGNAPQFQDFLYTQSGTPDFFGTFSGTVSVPEPATLALLGAGLMGLGVIRRRRKTV